MSVKCTTCDKSCSFRKEPFSPDYTALLARHNTLVEAVKKILVADDALYDARQNGDASDEYEIRAKAYASARAEVDKLLEERE